MKYFCMALLLATGLYAGPVADGRDFTARFEAEVSNRKTFSAAEAELYARYLAKVDEVEPGRFVAVVDRNRHVQALLLFWRAEDGGFHLIGASPVSTGQPGRFDYFETQVGVFAHVAANPDYRAEGTRNENGIRGYGEKGMRVYDFGWVPAPKGWGDHGEIVMRFQMHATDPKILEPRLGKPGSKGCVRIPSSLNVFLDRYGILDGDYQRVVAEGNRPLVLRPDWSPTQWAGWYLVVVDTSGVWMTPAKRRLGIK